MKRENNLYDDQNIFAKILKKEIPCETIYEDEDALFFKDINPKAKVHVLGIPKVHCVDFYDFVSSCDERTVAEFFNKVQKVIKLLNLQSGGYRLISNSGIDGCQEVPHFHIHILGGEKLTF